MAYDQDADDRDFELHAAHDYKVEAYGDRCPGCGTLRWGGDCPKCYHEEEELSSLQKRAAGLTGPTSGPVGQAGLREKVTRPTHSWAERNLGKKR
jgi:hypothetical protein